MNRIFLATTLILLAASTALFANTAILDATGKTLTCDVAALDCEKPRIIGDQVGAFIASKSLQPQDFKLVVKGLTSDSYDVYICGKYVGKRSAKQLTDGIKMSIPGTVGLPVQMRCLNALKDKISPEIDRLSNISGADPFRVVWTLRQANGMVESGIRNEELYRSVDIILAPEGHTLRKMIFKTRLDEVRTKRAIINACALLQSARARMYENINDPVLRNRAVEVMTPVTFTPVYQMKDGKPYVTAVVVNDCNLPISGNITFALPKGWKTDAKQLYFNNLESGQTYKTTFTLIAPSETDAAPQELPIAANISLKEGKFEAKLKLRVVQMLGS